MTNVTTSSSETVRHLEQVHRGQQLEPEAAAPTKPSTSDDRMFSSSRYSAMPSSDGRTLGITAWLNT